MFLLIFFLLIFLLVSFCGILFMPKSKKLASVLAIFQILLFIVIIILGIQSCSSLNYNNTDSKYNNYEKDYDYNNDGDITGDEWADGFKDTYDYLKEKNRF